MIGIQGLMMKTEYMMEQIRRNAIDGTFEKYKEACRRYHTQGYDNGETVAFIKELERLGANMEAVTDAELEIMDEVYGRA